ncbi:MAG: SAM-dependent methyltransferase [Chitinophagales bacterium]|nr:SAM-dependent methyltransferase [Chitinophagales bacterium]MDW8418472.1 SAM-dependent methyltransferase [Chitinophagales bacterium]
MGIEKIIGRLRFAFEHHCFVKLTLSKPRRTDVELKNVYFRPVILKSGTKWQAVYRYTKRDVTKNYAPEEAIQEITKLISTDFYEATLLTTGEVCRIIQYPNGKWLWREKKDGARTVNTLHDRQKHTVISPDRPYLYALGITTKTGEVRQAMFHKYRQIVRYLELLTPELSALPGGTRLRITDMGSGKGYLTFALYDYLVHQLGKPAKVTGVEMREELVKKCNDLAERSGFSELRFEVGQICDAYAAGADVVIALHACDTATDSAIAAGIRNKCKLIVCAPCCHKQLRREYHPTFPHTCITQFNILEERLAEMLTDTIRAMMLQAFGYQTKVMEFVSAEHTAKNLLITASRKREMTQPDEEILEKIRLLKNYYGVQTHALEVMLQLHGL